MRHHVSSPTLHRDLDSCLYWTHPYSRSQGSLPRRLRSQWASPLPRKLASLDGDGSALADWTLFRRSPSEEFHSGFDDDHVVREKQSRVDRYAVELVASLLDTAESRWQILGGVEVSPAVAGAVVIPAPVVIPVVGADEGTFHSQPGAGTGQGTFGLEVTLVKLRHPIPDGSHWSWETLPLSSAEMLGSAELNRSLVLGIEMAVGIGSAKVKLFD